MHALLHEPDIGKVRESRGAAWLANDMIKLPDEMAVVKAAKQELENVAKQITRK
jgi:hypothetical protein